MIIENHNQPVKLPDFFVVGAAKSATTSLYTYLNQHPGIFLPDRKELYYFAFNGETPRYNMDGGAPRPPMGRTREQYLEMYRDCPAEGLMGDTSSWYLYYHREVIRNVRALYGDRAREVRIVMVLRNPIERAWSHYSMHAGHGNMDRPFKEVIEPAFFKQQQEADEAYFPGYDYIGFGMYAEQVKAYLDAFGHVKIILYEDFNRDAAAQMAAIYKFLGLDVPEGELDAQKRLNVSGVPRSGAAAFFSRLLYKPYAFKRLFTFLLPESVRYRLKNNLSRYLFKKKGLSPEDRALLTGIYREDIARLQDIIARDLSTWTQPR